MAHQRSIKPSLFPNFFPTAAVAGIPTAARGVLATAYVAGRARGSHCSPCAIFEASRNAGRTWSRHVVPGAQPSIYSFSPSDPIGPNSAGQHIGNDSQNVWFEPYVAADPSHAGRYTGAFDATKSWAFQCAVTNKSPNGR